MNMKESDTPKKDPDRIDHFKPRLLTYLKLNSSAEKPVLSALLQRMWSISDLLVRQAIGRLRDDGHPIASGAKGFYLARKPAELESTISNFADRISALNRRRDLLIKAKIKLGESSTGQRLLFDKIDEL